MAVKQHTFEGWADGDTITTGGTGSGTVFDKVSSASGLTVKARALSVVNGTVGCRATCTNNVAAYVAYNVNSGATSATTYAEAGFQLPGGGYTASTALLRGMDTTDVTQRWRVSVTAAGKIFVNDSANTTIVTSANGYNGTSVRIKIGAEGSASANWTLKIYGTPNSSTPTESLSGSAANFGGVVQVIRAGITAASGAGIVGDFDDFAAADGGDDLGTFAIAPTGIGSTAALGSQTLADGSLHVTPTAVASTLSIGALALTGSGLAVAPTGIASTAQLGALSTVDGSMTTAPAGIASTRSVGTPSVVDGSLPVTPTGVASTSTLGSLALADGSLSAHPSGIATAVQLGAPSVTDGSLAVSPAGIASPVGLGVPTLTQAMSVSPAPITGAATVGTPSTADASMTVAPTGVPSPATLGSPGLADASMIVTPSGITAASTLGAIALVLDFALTPDGISDGAALGDLVLTKIPPTPARGIPNLSPTPGASLRPGSTATLDHRPEVILR